MGREEKMPMIDAGVEGTGDKFMAKTARAFEKHILKNIQESPTFFPDGILCCGLGPDLVCPKCDTTLSIVDKNLNPSMWFHCPAEGCDAKLVMWEPDVEATHCPGFAVEFYTFRKWNDYVRKSHCR